MVIKKCSSCKKHVTKKVPGLECSRCDLIIHADSVCSKLTNKQLTTLRNTSGIEWSCEGCLQNVSRRSSFVIPEDDADDDSDTGTIINQPSFETKKLIQDISRELQKTIRLEIGNLETSLEFLSNQICNIEKSNKLQENQIKTLEKKNEDLNNKNKNLDLRVTVLEQEMKQFEQKNLSSSLEIAGLPNNIPIQEAEMLIDNISKKLDVDRKEVQCFRRLPSGKDKPGVLLVEMKSLTSKQSWIGASKQKRITVGEVLPHAPKEIISKRIYVREALTKSMKSLLYNAKKDLGDSFQFVWYKDGKIGPAADLRWQLSGSRTQEDNNIAIHVIPPDGEEDDEFVLPLQARVRRKMSTPLNALPGATESLLSLQNSRRSSTRSLSPLDRTKRRFSTMVSSATASAVTRRLSATIGWCLSPTPTQVKPHIVRQGRALCLQYIKTQIRRSATCPKKPIVMKRLQRMLETECGEEASNNIESRILSALRALCAALERKKPEAFRHVARQATRAPSAMLKSDTALAELALALARRITRENITWSKIAAVYCICGALAREAAEASDEEPPLDLVAAPAAAIADLLHEEPGSWIANHGGWDGLIDRLKASERDQQSEKNLRRIITVFILICISLLLLRWVLRSY